MLAFMFWADGRTLGMWEKGTSRLMLSGESVSEFCGQNKASSLNKACREKVGTPGHPALHHIYPILPSTDPLRGLDHRWSRRRNLVWQQATDWRYIYSPEVVTAIV